eukprot:gene5355-6026_t
MLQVKFLFLFIAIGASFVAIIEGKPGRGRGRCRDKGKRGECADWKKQGFCKSSSEWFDYMKNNCKKSCGLCPGGKKAHCDDKEKKECPGWKVKGYCKETSQWYGYLKENCKKTCGFCPSDKFSTDNNKLECKDSHKECPFWSTTNECTKNPTYMGKTCRKSCKLCTPTGPCKDKTNECKDWAASGECKKNPNYMYINCERSCGVCKDTSTSTGSSGTGSSGSGSSAGSIVDKDTTTLNHQYCGLRLKLRVVGGDDAKSGDWPWQIAIAKKQTPTQMFCGGALINKQWVVTASHCFGSAGSNRIKPADIIIRIAEHDMTKNEGVEIVSNVVKIIRHAAKAAEKPSQMCYITGWGRVSEYGKTANILQEAKMPIIKRETCVATQGGIATYTANMICAGYKKGGIDACQGDSGGPLVCDNGGRYELIGIVSWGRGCARANSYGVYTKVSNYIDWIKNNIKS